MIQASTLRFLKSLKKNNNKPWFDAHRADYENARKDFEQFIQSVIDKHSKKDPVLKGMIAKSCVFRINRDIRFSKDKTPYKTHFGASIIRGGKKSPFAGYYFHLEPGDIFTGGGLWMPTPPDLQKIRQEIDYDLPTFKKILGSKKFKSVYKELSREKEYVLSRVPKGYEADNPAAEFLKLKCHIALTPLNDADISSDNFLRKTLQAFETLQPLIEFLNRSIE